MTPRSRPSSRGGTCRRARSHRARAACRRRLRPPPSSPESKRAPAVAVAVCATRVAVDERDRFADVRGERRGGEPAGAELDHGARALRARCGRGRGRGAAAAAGRGASPPQAASNGRPVEASRAMSGRVTAVLGGRWVHRRGRMRRAPHSRQRVFCARGGARVRSHHDDRARVPARDAARPGSGRGRGRAGVARRHRPRRRASSSSALRNHHTGTAEHSNRLAVQCRRVGERLGLSADVLFELELVAILHDIGKLAVPAAILDLARPLNSRERAVVRSHTIRGAEILAQIAGPRASRPARALQPRALGRHGLPGPDRRSADPPARARRVHRRLLRRDDQRQAVPPGAGRRRGPAADRRRLRLGVRSAGRPGAARRGRLTRPAPARR